MRTKTELIIEVLENESMIDEVMGAVYLFDMQGLVLTS